MTNPVNTDGESTSGHGDSADVYSLQTVPTSRARLTMVFPINCAHFDFIVLVKVCTVLGNIERSSWVNAG